MLQLLVVWGIRVEELRDWWGKQGGCSVVWYEMVVLSWAGEEC